MIEIRQLREKEWRQAMELKITCWTEELAGKAPNTLALSEQLDFWTNWMYTATDNNDIRVMLGAFEENNLLGVAIGSIAEITDIPGKGIELNGLWVTPEHRNRGVSLRLLLYLLSYFQNFNMEQVVIYNYHHNVSNTFYRKFGAKVIKQDYQTVENAEILTDIFIINIEYFKEELSKTLVRYL
ncbi:MAG: GNAT family N-acetyltransferase [Oscillospiraceae bacterium]|nr:GNAT family N-acetyltransferase [Oscillospiraceae bacterium]